MPQFDELRAQSNPTTVHLLVVDDDEVDQMLIKRAFRKQKIGNPLHSAQDGQEALDILRGSNGRGPLPKPYIILLDLKMPRMSGLEFLEEIRKDPNHKHAIIFVLTTSKDEQDRLRAYDKHVAGYIVKSNVSNEFMEVIGLLDYYWRIVELPDWENSPCLVG